MTSAENSSAPAAQVALDKKQDGPATTNDYLWVASQNLPNHSAAKRGQLRFVAPALNMTERPMIFRNKQEAFRCAAWLITMADSWLPDDPNAVYSFDEIEQAVRNT